MFLFSRRAAPCNGIAALVTLFLLAVALWPQGARAHHVLGRPAYNLSEDSNTPSSMQGEVLLGKYSVTYMIFPAFPKPGAPGRINVYATSNETGKPFDGKVEFLVRERGWLSWLGINQPNEHMGTQPLDSGVYRQPFAFKKNGDYIVSARFTAQGEPYLIDFPMRVGPPPVLGPIGIAVGLIGVLLLSVTLIQRRRTMTGKIRAERDHSDKTT